MKRFLTAILVLSILAAPAVCRAGRGQTLSFSGLAQVGGGWVSLYDLAQHRDKLPASLASALKKQIVMRAPSLGRNTEVPGSKLKALVRQAKLPKGVTVLIPARVTVERKSQVLTAADLAAIYRRALIRALGPQAQDADIHSIAAGRDLRLPAGKVTTNVKFVTGSYSGRVPANVMVAVGGKRIAQVRVVGQVDVYAEVVVAVHTLGRKHVISAEDVKTMRVNISDMSGAPATDPESVVGLRTRKLIPAGRPMALAKLEKAPLIRRGDVVTMVCRGQGINITAKGKANQTGYKNSRIRLINLASKREVYGTVLDSGTVLVRF